MSRPPHQAASGSGGFDPFSFAIRTWATSIEVFTRRHVGSRYLGLEAAAVVVLIPFYISLWNGHDCMPLVYFIPAYITACVMHRIAIIRRRWKAEPCHSRYSGAPRCWRLFPKCMEITVRKWIEPGLIAAFGYVVIWVNEPCGWYLIVGASCMSLTSVVGDAWIYCRALDLYDSTQDQMLVAERFREIRGDRF